MTDDQENRGWHVESFESCWGMTFRLKPAHSGLRRGDMEIWEVSCFWSLKDEKDRCWREKKWCLGHAVSCRHHWGEQHGVMTVFKDVGLGVVVVFIAFIIIIIIIVIILTMQCGFCDLSSSTRDWIWALAVKALNLNPWTTREFPPPPPLLFFSLTYLLL